MVHCGWDQHHYRLHSICVAAAAHQLAPVASATENTVGAGFWLRFIVSHFAYFRLHSIVVISFTSSRSERVDLDVVFLRAPAHQIGKVLYCPVPGEPNFPPPIGEPYLHIAPRQMSFRDSRNLN